MEPPGPLFHSAGHDARAHGLCPACVVSELEVPRIEDSCRRSCSFISTTQQAEPECSLQEHTTRPLDGLAVLDVGCGGGLLAEVGAVYCS